jgi:hypothetical protein
MKEVSKSCIMRLNGPGMVQSLKFDLLPWISRQTFNSIHNLQGVMGTYITIVPRSEIQMVMAIGREHIGMISASLTSLTFMTKS